MALLYWPPVQNIFGRFIPVTSVVDEEKNFPTLFDFSFSAKLSQFVNLIDCSVLANTRMFNLEAVGDSVKM